MAEHYGQTRRPACRMPAERNMPLTGDRLCGCDTHPCEHDPGRPGTLPTDSRHLGRPYT